jgi:hypothetical protein
MAGFCDFYTSRRDLLGGQISARSAKPMSGAWRCGPHIIIQSLHLVSENLSSTSQKDFCNNIDPKQTGAPLQCSGRAQRAVSELATDIGKSVVASGR